MEWSRERRLRSRWAMWGRRVGGGIGDWGKPAGLEAGWPNQSASSASYGAWTGIYIPSYGPIAAAMLKLSCNPDLVDELKVMSSG